MVPLKMPQSEIEMYIDRAKTKYLEKYVYSERRFGRYFFFSIFFLVTGLVEGSLLVHWLDSVNPLIGGRVALTILPAIIQLVFYFIFYRDAVNREKQNANKPANINFMLQEILEEDAQKQLPRVEGLYVILNKFRYGELLLANRPEDLEVIDQTLEIVKRFRDANRAGTEEIQKQRLQFIQSQLEPKT